MAKLEDFAGSKVTGLRIRHAGGIAYESAYTYLVLLQLKRARASYRRRIIDGLARALGKSHQAPCEILISFEEGECVETFCMAAGR